MASSEFFRKGEKKGKSQEKKDREGDAAKVAPAATPSLPSYTAPPNMFRPPMYNPYGFVPGGMVPNYYGYSAPMMGNPMNPMMMRPPVP